VWQSGENAETIVEKSKKKLAKLVLGFSCSNHVLLMEQLISYDVSENPQTMSNGIRRKSASKKTNRSMELTCFARRRQFVAFDVDSKCSSCLGRRRLTHHTSYAEQLTFTLKAVKDIKPLNEASISTFNKKCLHLRGSSSSSSTSQHLFQLMKFPARCFPLSTPKGSFSFEMLYRAEGETRQIISRTRRHQATVETGYDRKMKEKKNQYMLIRIPHELHRNVSSRPKLVSSSPLHENIFHSDLAYMTGEASAVTCWLTVGEGLGCRQGDGKTNALACRLRFLSIIVTIECLAEP
jgi:hypothetical protein